MKRAFIMALSSLSLAVMTFMSLQATESQSDSIKVEQAQQDTTEAEQPAKLPKAEKPAKEPTVNKPSSKTDTLALISVIGLVLSSLSIIIGSLCFVLIRKQKVAIEDLKGRMDKEITELNKGAMNEEKVEAISKTIAEKLNDDLQMRLENKLTAMEMANQARQIQAETPIVKAYEPKIFYASFSPSYLGFRGDELFVDQTTQVTFRIKTINETSATYQLLENVSSSLIDSSQLDACEYTGNPQSYTFIRLIEEGVLEYVTGSDYWRIEKKAIISFE